MWHTIMWESGRLLWTNGQFSGAVRIAEVIWCSYIENRFGQDIEGFGNIDN